jgi:hypothetical protein
VLNQIEPKRFGTPLEDFLVSLVLPGLFKVNLTGRPLIRVGGHRLACRLACLSPLCTWLPPVPCQPCCVLDFVNTRGQLSTPRVHWTSFALSIRFSDVSCHFRQRASIVTNCAREQARDIKCRPEAQAKVGFASRHSPQSSSSRQSRVGRHRIGFKNGHVCNQIAGTVMAVNQAQQRDHPGCQW